MQQRCPRVITQFEIGVKELSTGFPTNTWLLRLGLGGKVKIQYYKHYCDIMLSSRNSAVRLNSYKIYIFVLHLVICNTIGTVYLFEHHLDYIIYDLHILFIL